MRGKVYLSPIGEFSYQEKTGIEVTESTNAVGTLELTAPAVSLGS